MADIVKYYLDDLSVGMSASTTATITAEMIDAFADITGDHNPIHVDEEYAKTTQFGGRIAHGALSASFISAVLGNDLPGPGAIFVELNLRFRKPAMINDVVTAVATIEEINERTGRVKMKCHCEVDGVKICRGDAGVFVQKRPND
ncbi:3-hydroxybutyryl-CoA dehydratase [Algimonas ampicilliniresistens]|jgi:3-hydroxybutyryl-CoA dehydratase|uniref:3-hydroxybutyryl-CoA dehydratase n=1 Tax=Algimonas ampicilliniresistens TaxID=1298735 RepID=A0ABQ5V5K2_9PROT|nr:MaoC family dehydratase [Algimonas ampicilliniresistens]GLQ22254.1 3-hydroxybutyryl-CoA dehydratase [Algimonas ampicilliniresistens]